MATDLEIAFTQLTRKRHEYPPLWAFYDGVHPLKYSARRLYEVFSKVDARFTLNWCALVIDAILERVEMERYDVTDDDEMTSNLNLLRSQTQLNLDDADVHLATLVTGEAFVIVWPDEDGNPEAYYNRPALMHCQYDEDSPRKMLWAAKCWQRGDGKFQMTFYYADRLEKWETRGKMDAWPATPDPFVKMDDGESKNPYDQIPVFHFRRERRAIISELRNVIEPQSAINKLFSDMMVSAEFSAFPQRWIIGNADLKVLKANPYSLWKIPPGDGEGQQTSMGQFGVTDLSNFMSTMDDLAGSISAITRTPRHFFFPSGGVPSGEALIALEAPLNHKCGHYIERFASTWQQVGVFLLRVAGHEVELATIVPIFRAPETVQPQTRSQIRVTDKSAGLPLVTILKREGWSDEEIDAMLKDRREEVASAQTGVAQAWLDAQRKFDRGEGS